MRRVEGSGLGSGEATAALLGGFVGLLGTYWDDAWHTDRGRDTFASPPHLVLYAGVVVGLAVALRWVGRAARKGGWLDALQPSSRVAVACWGGLAVLVSAPSDELWHRAYGRDAVLWSPPHLLAVSGSAALLVGLVLGMRPGSTRARLGAAMALGAYLVPVMEYEADVPQFSAAFYLPVVALGLALARPVALAAVGGRWPLTTAAAAYTVFRLFVAAGLATLGHSTLIVPPLLLAAVAIDVAARAGRPWIVPLATGIAIPITYAPILSVLTGAPRLRGADLGFGVGLSVLTGVAAALPAGVLRRPAVVGAIVLVLATGGVAMPAAAHDPGQGDVVGEVSFRVTVDGLSLDVVADLPDRRCSGGDIAVVARRGGRTVRATASTASGCVAVGTLNVDEPGRWFVYVEQDRLEAWVPVDAGGRRSVVDVRDLYERPPTPSGTTKPIASAALLAAALALAAATARVSSGRGGPRQVSATSAQ